MIESMANWGRIEKALARLALVTGAIFSIWKCYELFFGSPPREYSITASRCIEGEWIDHAIKKRLWHCKVRFVNETDAARSLKVVCQVTNGDFVGEPQVLSSGNGAGKLCFDALSVPSKECQLAMEKDEFIQSSFEVAAYENPAISCFSDRF